MKKQINPSIKAHLLPSLFILLSLLVIGSTVARALPLSAGRQSQGPASDGAVGSSAPNTQAIRALEAPNDPAAWQPGPPQPPARYAFQAALGTDNLLYVAGGQTADMTPTLYNQVSRYDYTTNTWSNVAPLPVALGQGAIGAWNGKIYVAGGFIGGTSATNALRIYDITTNTWTSGPNMPTSPGVEAAAGAVVNGKFYVMGGDDFNNGLNTNFIYDTATNTWSTGATLPDNRTNTYGTAYNGLIYVYGGVILPAFTTTDTLLRYDPVANSWTSLGSAGTGGRGNYGAISPFGTGQLLITDGADASGNSTTSTHIFTISSGTFSAGPAMIGNRAGHAQGTLPDGRVLVADGFNTASTVVSTVELLTTPPCLTPTPTATATPTIAGMATPTPTCSPSGLLIVAGQTNEFYDFAELDDIVRYSFAQSQPRANQFAIFRTHAPWGNEYLTNHITSDGYTYTTFTPAQFTGFNFAAYRVVVLDWSDTNVSDFDPPYSTVITQLEAYVNGGGVVWIEGPIQNGGGSTYVLPFGGTATFDL